MSNKTKSSQVTLLPVVGHQALTFNELVKEIEGGTLEVTICQECGCIVAGWPEVCPECASDNLMVAREDTLDEVVEQHYPWRPCEHCGYAFLWDDDVAKEIEPDASKLEGDGLLGCPACRKLTY